MPAPTLSQDHYRLQDIIRSIKSEADTAAKKAADKARTEAEERFIAELRQQYGGKTLYCYDESHENRFVRKPFREWNAVALSFKECVDKMRPHVFRYHSEDQWTRIEGQLTSYSDSADWPSLDPEQTIVFQAGNYWYCFFCINGDEFCDKVVEYLASERKEDARRANQPCGCCSVD